jgi:hypothetical protein
LPSRASRVRHALGQAGSPPSVALVPSPDRGTVPQAGPGSPSDATRFLELLRVGRRARAPAESNGGVHPLDHHLAVGGPSPGSVSALVAPGSPGANGSPGPSQAPKAGTVGKSVSSVVSCTPAFVRARVEDAARLKRGQAQRRAGRGGEAGPGEEAALVVRGAGSPPPGSPASPAPSSPGPVDPVSVPWYRRAPFQR